MMKKAHKNNLDEMQDQKLLKLEEYGVQRHNNMSAGVSLPTN